MDVKSITSKTYKSIEKRLGPQIEKVARTSCFTWLDQEVKRTDGNNDLAISYDMGWQKRGNARNSRTGRGTAAGRATGKIVDFETRNTTCQIYESASKSGKRPHTHDSRKNHTGSSRSMEAGAAAKIYERAKACGNRYSTFIGRQVAGKFEQKILFHK